MASVVSALPGRLNIRLYRGDDFRMELTIVSDATTLAPIDITDYSFAAEIRDTTNGTLLATFTDTTIDAEAGRLDLTLARAVTQALPDGGVWDLEVTDTDGKHTTWFAGTVSASGDVTEI